MKKLSKRLQRSLLQNAIRKRIQTRDGSEISYDEFNVSLSKNIIDQIDKILQEHYEMTDEELDFVVNYDIKYRLG